MSRLTRLSALLGRVINFEFDPEDWNETANIEDGRVLHIGRLIARTNKRKIEKIPLDEIIGSRVDGGLSRSPRDGFSNKRLAATDTRYPLIVDKENVLLNGRHRALKLKSQGKKHVKIVRATDRDIKETTMSARGPILKFAAGDISRRYLPDEPIISSGELLKAATAKKKPITKKARPRKFKPEVKHFPGTEAVDAARSRAVIEKMRGGTASPEDKAFLKTRVSKKAAQTRDPAKWLAASKGEGLNSDFRVTDKGKIEPTHPDEPRLYNAELPQGRKKKIGSPQSVYSAPIEEDPTATRGRSGALKSKASMKIARTNKKRISIVTGRLRAQAQNFRDSTANQLKERRGLIQDIRKESNPQAPLLADRSYVKPVGSAEIGKPGVANKPAPRPPISILGRQHTVPGDLAEIDKFVRSETQGRIEKRQAVRTGSIKAIKSRVLEGAFPGVTPGPHQHEDVKTMTGKLETGEAMLPHEKQTLAQHLNASRNPRAKAFTPGRIEKIQKHLKRIEESTTTEPGIKKIRSQAVRTAIPIIDARPAAAEAAVKGYPALKKIGRGLGVAGLIGAGALAVKGLRERKKENQKQLMSSIGRVIHFARLDPIPRLRVGKGIQSHGAIKEGSALGSSIIDHLHRARLAAQRGDPEAFKAAGAAAGLFKDTISTPKLYRRMQAHRAWTAVQEARSQAAKPVTKSYKRRVEKEMSGKFGAQLDEVKKTYAGQIGKITKEHENVVQGHISTISSLRGTLRNEEATHAADLAEESARADSEYGRGKKTGNRRAIIGTTAGVGAGAIGGYEAGKERKRNGVTAMAARSTLIQFGLYHRVGNVTIIGKAGQSAEEISRKYMSRLTLRQPAVSGMTTLMGHAEGISSGAARDKIRAHINERHPVIGGTVASGKKGPRAYVNRGFRKDSGIGLREVAHHEAFHNIPIIGQSEIAAHFVGAARAEKGRFNPGAGVKRIGHLAEGRPGRFGIEVAAIGGTAAGGYALKRKISKKNEAERKIDTVSFSVTPLQNLRNKIKPPEEPKPLHDILTGAAEGGVVGPFTEGLFSKLKGGAWESPLKHGVGALGKNAAIGAGLGAVTTAVVGNVISRAARKRQQNASVQFAAVAYPANRTAVTRDRYSKKIHETDMTKAENNYVRAGLGGAAVSALLRKRSGLALRPAAIAGAGAGLAVQAIVRNRTAKTKDQFGDRSYAAKRIDNAPGQAALLGAGVIATNRAVNGTAKVRSLIRKVRGLSSLESVIQFDRSFTDKWTQNVNVDRRGEDLYRWGSRAHRAIRDIRRSAKGEPNLDARGRQQTPEWKKPWAKRAAILGGLGLAVYGVSKGRGVIKGMSAAADVAGKHATPLEKLAQYTEHGNTYRAAKKTASDAIDKVFPGTTSTVRQAGGEIKGIIKKMASKPAEKLNQKIVSKVGDITTKSVAVDETGKAIANVINPAADAEKAAALKPHQAALQKKADQVGAQIKKHESAAEERKRKLTEMISPRQFSVINLAEYQQNWRTSDERGNSARVFAPGHQTRIRRPKDWHERKANRDLIAAGIIGAGSLGGLALGFRGGIGRGVKKAEAAAVEKATATAEAKANERIKKHFRDRGNPGPIQAHSKDPLIYLSFALDKILSTG